MILFSIRKTAVSGWVGKSRLQILETTKFGKLSSASFTVMTTIRCVDIAASALFVAECSSGASFAIVAEGALLLRLLRKAAAGHPF